MQNPKPHHFKPFEFFDHSHPLSDDGKILAPSVLLAFILLANYRENQYAIGAQRSPTPSMGKKCCRNTERIVRSKAI